MVSLATICMYITFVLIITYDLAHVQEVVGTFICYVSPTKIVCNIQESSHAVTCDFNTDL